MLRLFFRFRDHQGVAPDVFRSKIKEALNICIAKFHRPDLKSSRFFRVEILGSLLIITDHPTYFEICATLFDDARVNNIIN